MDTTQSPTRRVAIEAIAVAAVALLAAGLLLRIWDASLAIPFDYGADTNFNGAVAKSIDEHGWYFETPEIGWPRGSQLYDLPIGGDNLQLAAIKAFTLFTGWAQSLNLYYLLTFPLIAVSAFLVARRSVGFSRGTAVVVALIFAFLPYHFARGESHLFLANYAVVPLAAVLILDLMRAEGDPPWTTLARGQRSRLWFPLLACAVIASTATYYAVFTGLLMVGVGALAALRERDWRPLAWGGGVAAALAAVLVVNLLPTLIYWQSNGRNDVGSRAIQDSEQFGLRMSQLLFPANDHRIKPLASAAEKARVEVSAPTEHGSALGIAGDVGLVAAVGVALSGARRRRHPSPGDDPESPRDPALASLGMASVVALLLGVSGGLGHLLALMGFTYIRGWNRISVFVAFFAALALGHLLERGRAWLRGRGVHPALGPVALGLVVVIGLLDQSPVHPFPRSYATVARVYRADEAVVRRVEERLGPDAAVFQVPITPYPEAGPTHGMPDYDHFRGYLHSDTLRWSYGATRGRQGVWLEELATLPPAAQVTVMAAVGFDGLWVNRAGFVDSGEAFEAAVKPLTGAFSEDDTAKIDTADLRPLAQRATSILGEDTLRAIANRAMHPILDATSAGWFPAESEAGHTVQWSGPTATLTITNPSTFERDVLVRFTLEGNRGDVTISWPGGSHLVRGTREDDRQNGHVGIRIPAAPGDTQVEITTGDTRTYRLADGRRVAFRVRDLLVTDALAITSAGTLINEA